MQDLELDSNLDSTTWENNFYYPQFPYLENGDIICLERLMSNNMGKYINLL